MKVKDQLRAIKIIDLEKIKNSLKIQYKKYKDIEEQFDLRQNLKIRKYPLKILKIQLNFMNLFRIKIIFQL